MNFETIIWGAVTPAVKILIPLFAIYFVLDILRTFYQWNEK